MERPHRKLVALTGAYLAFLVCLGLVTYWFLGSLMAHDELFVAPGTPTPILADFINHYNAAVLGKRCLQHERLNIYDPAVQSASIYAILKKEQPPKPFYFQYPPHFFALALPLCAFNILDAWWIWTAAGLIALLWSLYWLLAQTSLSRTAKMLAVIAMLVSFPTWLSIRMGQTAIFNLAAMVMFIACLKNRRFFLGGLAASFTTVKLQYAFIVLAIGLAAGGLPFALGAGCGLAALLCAALVVVGADNVLAFPHALVYGETSSSVFGVWPERMQNFRGQLQLFLPQMSNAVNVSSAIVLLAGAAVICVIWYRWRQSCSSNEGAGSDEKFMLLTALSIPTMLITSLHTHMYDYVMLCISFIWVWQWSSGNNLSARGLRLLILLFPFASWWLAYNRPSLEAVFIQPYAVYAGAYMILIVTTWLSRRSQNLAAAARVESQSEETDVEHSGR
jgi:hypothetical protein